MFLCVKMCNSIKNLIQKSKKEPLNLKEFGSAIQESRRKMSDNTANPKQIQQELQRKTLAETVVGKDSPSITSSVVSPSLLEPDGRQASIDESLSGGSVRNNNIPVIDENEDSSSSYSLAEKI